MRTSTSLSLVLLLGISACGVSQSDQPDLWANISQGNFSITLVRGWDHDLTGATATVNGVDMGVPVVRAGHQGRIGNPATSSIAEFSIPAAGLGTAIHAEIDDHGEMFTLDAPDLGVPRELHVVTSLDQPLTSTDSITLSTGVDGDTVSSGSQIMFGTPDRACTWASTYSQQGTSWVFPMTADFSDWYCGDKPAAGSVVPVTANFNINVRAQATCPDSLCSSVTPLGGGMQAAMPAQLQL